MGRSGMFMDCTFTVLMCYMLFCNVVLSVDMRHCGMPVDGCVLLYEVMI